MERQSRSAGDSVRRVERLELRKDWHRISLVSGAVTLTLAATMLATPALAETAQDGATAAGASASLGTSAGAGPSSDGATEAQAAASAAASPSNEPASDESAANAAATTAATTSATSQPEPSTGQNDQASAKQEGTTESQDTGEVVASLASGGEKSRTSFSTVASYAAADGSAATSGDATGSAATVTVTLDGNTLGKLSTGASTQQVGATAGSTITLPTASEVTTTGKSKYHLAGWSANAAATSSDYLPGATYAVGDSSTTLYAVWAQTMTLAPTLNNISAYYMVVGLNGNVVQEGELPSGGATLTIPYVPLSASGLSSSEYFVNVFVRPNQNYLLTRVDSADINNFIYTLSGNYYGRPGNYVTASDIQRMRDKGYIATFGWGTGYHQEGDTLSVVATAEQPVPEAAILYDETSGLKAGDSITLTVTLKAGDIDNKYSASLDASKPVTVYVGEGDSRTALTVANVTRNKNADGTDADTYTGTVEYTLTDADVKANKIVAHVEATFDYSYAFGVRGDDLEQHTLDTQAVIDSQSRAVTVENYAVKHKVSYAYAYLGDDGTAGELVLPLFPVPQDVTTTKGNVVTVPSTPVVEKSTVRDEKRGGAWKFVGWTLYGEPVTSVTMGDDDLTLVGEWEFVADADGLTYVANAPEGSYTGTTAASEGVTGGLVVVSANGFVRDGYRFVGWNKAPDGSAGWYAADVDHYMLTTGNDVLYAQWEKASGVSYEFDYDGAEGVDASALPGEVAGAPTDDGEYYRGDTIAVAATPARGDVVDDPANHGTWTFGGWTLDGQAVGDSLTSQGLDVTLRGTWTFTAYGTVPNEDGGATSGGSSDGTTAATDGTGTTGAIGVTVATAATGASRAVGSAAAAAAPARQAGGRTAAHTSGAALARLPKTGDETPRWPLAAGVAGVAMALLGLLLRRRPRNDAS